MPNNSLRSALRARTADLHHALDRQVGEFSGADEYADYVSRSFLFRSAVEANQLSNDRWALPHLASALAQDLTDLARPMPLELPEPAPTPASAAAQLGVFYVLEGSAVGARLLLKRARAIGMTETFGARHLGQQSGDPMRWPQFLALLETIGSDEHDHILQASEDTFHVALKAYSTAVR